MKYECWQCGKLTDNWCEICDECLEEWRKEREEWEKELME